MGKSNSNQMLSPENYIRTRARSLPIHECLINPGWEEARMANILISRRHVNGNLTYCIFLVDLYCRGVKDTGWQFNITQSEYAETKENILQQSEIMSIPYDLAHNIILAAHEFAEEFGISSHKDFISTTQFMLEDDDKVEMIEIECGLDGKPAYLSSPDDNENDASRIIHTLQQTAGPGNFAIIFNDRIDENSEEENEIKSNPDKTEEIETKEVLNIVREMTHDEKKEFFMSFAMRPDDMPEAEKEKFFAILDDLFDFICDEHIIKVHRDFLDKDMGTPVSPFVRIPDEMLGIEVRNADDLLEYKKAFLRCWDSIGDNPRKTRKYLDDLMKTSQVPATGYLELKYMLSVRDKNFTEKLKHYSALFPQYSLIQMMVHQEETLRRNVSDFHDLEYFYPGRKELHIIEIIEYLNCEIFALNNSRIPERIMAFYDALLKYDKLPSETLYMFLGLLQLLKISILAEYFSNENSSIPKEQA